MSGSFTIGDVTYEKVTMCTPDDELEFLKMTWDDGDVAYIHDPTQERHDYCTTMDFYIWNEDQYPLFESKEAAVACKKHGNVHQIRESIADSLEEMDIQALIKLKEILKGDSKS